MKKIIFIASFLFLGCAHYNTKIPVEHTTVKPGTSVKLKDKFYKLYSTKNGFKIGDNFVSKTNKVGFDFPFKNTVTIINIVPSVDTAVCEAQSHILSENKSLNSNIDRVSISRDLPMALKRFSKQSKLTNINYLSDYKKGVFGRRFGLMIKDLELLSRGVIVLDKNGVIKYMQFVPEVTHLPDMSKAFKVANSLAK